MLGRARCDLGADRPLEALTPRELRDWLLGLRATLAPVSVAGYPRGLKAFGNWCATEELAEARALRMLRRPRVPHKLVEPLSDDALRRLLDGASTRDRAILLLFFDTGLRLSELAGCAAPTCAPTNIDEVELTRYRLQLPPADGAGPQLRDLPPAELLAAIGATALAETGAPLLTVAGILVFCGEDNIRQTLPQHQVVYLRTLSGTTDYERRVVSSAPLLRLVDVLMTEITAASRVRTLRLGRQDIEVPDYPERVLREAIVNSIAHCHYTVLGDTVIRQSASALEIESPGGFPEGVTADTIIQHAPVHRNRLLCEILDRVRSMERSGLGVDRIYEDQLRF